MYSILQIVNLCVVHLYSDMNLREFPFYQSIRFPVYSVRDCVHVARIFWRIIDFS